MVGKSTRTDWLGILKSGGGEADTERNEVPRTPGELKVRKVQKGPNTREAPQKRGVVNTLTVHEVLEEIAHPGSGAGIQARLYKEGKISKEDAIRWTTCAIVYRRMDKDACAIAHERWEKQKKAWQKGNGPEPVFFAGWENHTGSVQEALASEWEGVSAAM